MHPWEAPGWQVIAIDADVKQVITSWLQTCDNSVFTLDYELWYQCGVNAEMVVVTTLRSDVYHLHRMCRVLIKVTISFWHECLLPYFLEVLYIYIAVWAGGFISTRCSVWWGLCVICWLFLQWIICSSSDFDPAMPTQFCNLPYISIIYIESYACLVWKLFPLFCRYLCPMFVVVLSVTFIMPVIYSLLIAVVVVSSLCVYLTCWVATCAYSWINICRGWTNNGNTRQYRNKTVCVGCTEGTYLSLFFCLSVLYSASVSALHTVFSKSLYESTAKWETYQFFRQDRFLVHISWSICNQNGHY